MTEGALQYRSDIDGLRALAVVPVVLGHAHVPGFAGGYVGVDVFFVISGFLITTILVKEARDGRFSLAAFYERRARRLFPALFGVLLFCAAAAWVRFPADDFEAFGRSVLATIAFGSNVLFWSETGYFDVAAEQRPLLHTWSLAVEEQFYLLFPLAVWWTARRLNGRFALWLAPAMAASFVVSVVWVEVSPTSAFYLAPARAWELLVGSVLALGLVPSVQRPRHREGLAAFGVLLIAAGVLLFDGHTPFPGSNALVPCLGAAMVIHAGGARRTAVGRVLGTKPLVFLGLISYSLYLWHWPLLVFARRFGVEPLSPTETAGVVALSFAIAALSWRFVERPFRKAPQPGATGFAWDRKSIFSGSAIAGGTCALFAAGVIASSGVPSRFPDVTHLVEGSLGGDIRAPEGCDVLRQAAGEMLEHCGFGADANGAPRLVVWGDSHALSWRPTFERFANEHGVRGVLMTTPGCPSLATAFRRDERQAAFECDPESTRHLFEATVALQPEVVFLVSRWAIYHHGWLLSDARGESKSELDSKRVFERTLGETVAALRAQGVEVVLVKSVPFLANKPPELFANELAGTQHRTLLTEHRTRQETADRHIDAEAAVEGVFALDPADVFCDRACRYHDGTGFFYRDDNHLSRYGAAVLYEGLREQLEAIWQSAAAADPYPANDSANM